MIGNIIRNSSVNAKMHAKMRKCLKPLDYENIINMNSVPDVAEFLKNKSGFNNLFENLDIASLHRGEFEAILKKVLTSDIRSFFAFTGNSTKFFLKVYVIRNEIEYLKIMLRMLESEIKLNAKMVENSMGEFGSNVDFTALANAKSFDEFCQILKPTIYYKPLSGFASIENGFGLFEVESTLDRFYLRMVESFISKYLSKADAKLVRKTFGVEADLDNIMLIIRAKTFYKLDKELIYFYLDKKETRLSSAQINDMVLAETPEDLHAAVVNTPYGKLFEDGYEKSQKQIYEYITDTYRKVFKGSPYTVEAVLYYIKIKETEIRNLTMAIEGIRYKIPAADIRKYLIGIDKK